MLVPPDIPIGWFIFKYKTNLSTLVQHVSPKFPSEETQFRSEGNQLRSEGNQFPSEVNQFRSEGN